MELNPDTPLHWIDMTILMRLGTAAILGLLLGLDRELKGHDAGLRTHGLICFSAAVMTVCSIALYHQLDTDGSRMDPLRIFEGAGAFVGIIAAGLIVVSKGTVHNLTTAAHIWLATVIGIACGAGQWPLVLVAAIVAVVMMSGLALFERRWLSRFGQDREQG
ncbi:putative MgtC/SapB family transporter [Caenibius tardaugens NBRC 16725]|uniref:Protein MgtC n=1 Tax=Caenibius tardaugens NBRC 16725 TaxID=1219035 RepID=U2YQF5_9SPHN|nr:MgtC/SapB family protein [Caenibius tardaugens]AZI36314.1 MgtC/SapB family protein [Caenibius tardaugens NBRC 16725]GAD50897.1 putative MgtC/SapB family transporter [Caenibius tardaugens NBRC 16725]